jgi:hypothetical protein
MDARLGRDVEDAHEDAHGFQNPQGAEAFGGVLRRFEAHNQVSG